MRLAIALGLAAALTVAATASGHDAAHGAPKGFSPLAAAVVGTRDIWIFGSYRGCAGPCFALVRSRDGGRHFKTLAAPPLSGGPTLDFTGPRVGYAFASGSQLYVTRDGGDTWRSWSPAGVTDVAVGERDVYAVFTKYHRRSETGPVRPPSARVERRPVAGGSWHVVKLPVKFRYPISVAAQGRKVWLVGSTQVGAGLVTLRSTDKGRTFAQGDAFCLHNVPDQGGRLVPAGRRVVWAVCPTGDGNSSRLSLSTDGGRTFRPFGVTLKSGAEIFPSSADAAVLYRGGSQGPLLRTADLGRHWADARGTDQLWELFWLRFATSRAGAALGTTFSHPNRASFWRTTDGGATWHSLPIR
jgi:photosystem II stability/assembly factor-like uncharacterized protein